MKLRTHGINPQELQTNILIFPHSKEVRDNGDVVYTFTSNNRPPIYLEDTAEFISSINSAFLSIQLQPITQQVPELEEITKSRVDRGIFLWSDHPAGKVFVERSGCVSQIVDSYDRYA